MTATTQKTRDSADKISPRPRLAVMLSLINPLAEIFLERPISRGEGPTFNLEAP
ncbi:hypothetical protein C1H46_016377 [Malus baccata]|uniref:Uncharacterized protein n=1 Tax=Malus baccata TaxID=106549 RepID=A0A540MH27_MALBA|nr:hypothetical protein C1H46_016377 [Malus baccata]